MLHGELDEPASAELRETITKATKELTIRPRHRPRGRHVPAEPGHRRPGHRRRPDARSHGAAITFVGARRAPSPRALLTVCALDYVEELG